MLEDGANNVFIGRDQLPDAVKGVNIVVIGDEPCECQEEDRLKIIGPKIIRYTEAILKSSPNAIIVVAASPLNTLVPLVGHFLGPDWQHRLLGITSVDTLRASRLLNRFLGNPLGPAHILPVVGGASTTSRVPLFSHLHPKTVVCKEIREKILEKMKMFDNAKCPEMDSVERAYSAVRFIHSVISGMLKDSPIPEIAMTKTAVVPSTEFLSLPMLIGKNGIENSLPLPKFDEAEEKLFLEATERLAGDSRKAREFINSLAQDSVRNSKTGSNASISKSRMWDKNTQFSDKRKTVSTHSELRVGGAQETAVNQCKSPKLNKIGLSVNEVRTVNSRSQELNENELAQTSNSPSGRDPMSFTYRLMASSSGSNGESHEMQPPIRKPLPKRPTYQLIPESRGTNCDTQKVIGDDTSKINVNNETLKATENSVTSRRLAEDTSSRQSPTRTALETSNRTGAFEEHDVPQPASIQHLLPDVVPLEPVPTTNFSFEKKIREEKGDKIIERRPSLTDSDVSANDSHYTDILLEEVNNDLGALSKYADTFASVEGSTNEACGKSKKWKVIDGIASSKTDQSGAKQDIGTESIKQVVTSNNDEIKSDNNIQNHLDNVMGIQLANERRQIERDTNSSYSNQKVFQTGDLPNYESAPEFLNRKRVVSARKCDSGEKSLATDSGFVGGMSRNTGSTTGYSGPVDDINKTPQSRKSPGFSTFNTNNVDASGVKYLLHEKCNVGKDASKSNLGSGEIAEKIRRKNVSDENMWPPSLGGIAASDNCQKFVSKESGDASLDGKRKSQSVSNEELPNNNSKARYPIGFPSNHCISKMSGVAKILVSEERILCLSNGRMENSFNKNLLRDSKTICDLKKLSNKGTPKPETPSSKSMNSTEKDVNEPEMMLLSTFRDVKSANKGSRNRGMSFPSGAKSSSKVVEDVRQPRKGDDIVSSNIHAGRSGEKHCSSLAKDMKSGHADSRRSRSTQSDTPLRLLNLPGCQHRYEASLKQLDEKLKDVNTGVRDFVSGGKQNNLTTDLTKGYYTNQRIGSSLCNRKAHNSALNLESPIKKGSRKRCNKQKKTRTQKLKSSKKDIFQVGKESKKMIKQHQNTNWKQPIQVENQCGTPKNIHSTASKNTVIKNVISRKKKELVGVDKNSSDTVKGDEWESKYFTKASEMFFRMFRDSVADNKISAERSQMKTNVVQNKSKSSLPSASSPIQPSFNTTKDTPSCDKAVGVNKVHPANKSIDVNSIGNTAKPDVTAEKSENKWLASTISEIKKAKTVQKVKITEGSNLNKLKMLQSSDVRPETEKSIEESRRPDSIFNTKITGMEKYQLEKNDNVKKEISVNLPIDVEKLFEESSTIPLHGFSARKKWQQTNIVDEKGTKLSSPNNRSILQGINATSDKGRGDSINVIDFSVCKSPSLNEQASRNKVGLSREKSSSNSQTSMMPPASKLSSSFGNELGWRSPATIVPISSKTIKQVNPQNYREQILSSCIKKVEDETVRCEKTNKWERIMSVFKQIIIRDLEEERPSPPRSVKAKKSTKKKLPAQLLETGSNVSYSQAKPLTGGNRVLNHKIGKGKISSKVKKKTDMVKKKLPAETIRRNKVVKNNPKKIVNYFSKRGNAISTFEKSSVNNFSGISFEQAPPVIVGKHSTKPAISIIPPKMK